MSENTKDILNALMDRITQIAATKTVVGDPVNVGDKIIVPVVKVMIGVGAGSGSGNGNQKGDGSGGGAGLSISPVAFMVIDGHNIHLFGTKPSALDNLTAKLPDMLSSVLDKIPYGKRRKDDSKEEAKIEPKPE